MIPGRRRVRRGGARGGKGRLLVALVVAVIAVVSYFATTFEEENPFTGETQRLALTLDQEVKLGLQAAPEMAEQHGGLAPDPRAQQIVDEVGRHIVESSGADDTGYRFEFHLLADDQTVNAFALPGGQIFLTQGLAERLGSEAQLAGVLAHEVGHVVGRHAAERIAKARLAEGLTGAAVIATYDETGRGSGQMAVLVSQLLQMKHSRTDELESDRLGVRFLAEAGYDPRALIEVMNVLEQAGGGGQPEFLSTHPDPGNRRARIEDAIEELSREGLER